MAFKIYENIFEIVWYLYGSCFAMTWNYLLDFWIAVCTFSIQIQKHLSWITFSTSDPKKYCKKWRDERKYKNVLVFIFRKWKLHTQIKDYQMEMICMWCTITLWPIKKRKFCVCGNPHFFESLYNVTCSSLSFRWFNNL